MRMFRDKSILTQMCGNNFMVLKVAPPLTVSDEELDEFVAAITEVVHLLHSSSTVWTEALGWHGGDERVDRGRTMLHTWLTSLMLLMPLKRELRRVRR